ncbi:MAG: hypothetical protein MZU95_02300 [Desulfomicrobium escambiense]|nr:hypothetical protein [Desulfomicrobium escambiense]
MTLDGEYIRRAEPVLRLHPPHAREDGREPQTYAQFLPNTGRVDYLSRDRLQLTPTWARWRRAAGIAVPPRAEYIRVITSELNRISSHLLWWGAYLLDLGGFTPIAVRLRRPREDPGPPRRASPARA